MSIRNLYLVFFSGLLLLLGALAATVISLIDLEKELASANAQRGDSRRLAEELRQSSVDLTQMARLYVVTGEPRYEEYFQEVLGIRRGERPRPQSYDGLYWDFRLVEESGGRQRERTGRTVALIDLMREAQFSAGEFEYLGDARRRSDALVRLETQAMNAVKGIFADKNGEYTLRAEPDGALARALMHGEEYHRAKAAIMAPMREFAALVEARTRSEVVRFQILSEERVRLTMLLILLTFVYSTGALIVMRRRILAPLQSMAEGAAGLGRGDYGTRVSFGGKDEIGKLGESFNSMANSIEEDLKERVAAEVALRSARIQIEERSKDLAQALAVAESANRSKSQFLATMSHEIRTPMNGIIGLANVALNGDLNAQNQDYFTKISDAGNVLLGIVNDIFDLSSLEAGDLGLEKHAFNLRAALDDLEALHSTKLRSKGQRFSVYCSEDIPRALWGDKARLLRILSNYLSNAIKFSESGAVELRVSLAAQETLTLRFAVSDEGIGIPEEDTARLFQPFEQVDGSRARKFGGTGLGLVLAKKIAELAGGSVGVDSVLGKGSTFWVEMPFEQASAEALSKLASSQGSEEQGREEEQEVSTVSEAVDYDPKPYFAALELGDMDLMASLAESLPEEHPIRTCIRDYDLTRLEEILKASVPS